MLLTQKGPFRRQGLKRGKSKNNRNAKRVSKDNSRLAKSSPVLQNEDVTGFVVILAKEPVHRGIDV